MGSEKTPTIFICLRIGPVTWTLVKAGRDRSDRQGFTRNMLCTQCGKRLALADRFCSQCGAPNRELDNLIEVPPAGPTTPEPAPSAPAIAKPAEALGTKWLNFWTYFSVPVGGILSGACFFIVTDWWRWAFVVFAFFHFSVARGLHRRELSSWYANWVLVVLAWLGGAVPYEFGSVIDFAFKYGLVLVILGAFWMWPNYVYWMKRRVLFHEDW